MSEETTAGVVDAPPEVDEPVVRPDRKPADADADKKPKRLPPYVVILHDDDEHTYNYVIECLQKVCGYKVEKAFLLAQEVDKAGRAAVWSGSKEVAELKRDQIRGFGPDFYATKTVRFPLGVTIEPLPGD